MVPPFKISIKIPVPKKISMWVERYYKSDQVERYSITYGGKAIRIERRLKERKPWKILGANYDKFKPEDFAPYLESITEQIIQITKPPEPPYIHPKNVG